ncbi:hypothetical protein [Nostoc sp. NZL]|uniref:hypothetical protein n=1 Tax=Nostoc sp. NZL TaxID=2650612 RepID=UPI0018C67893|nr:hypothetical protein [Nostoc sp. NZL]MBG1240569.1 hypothetical protein [Nostoc sp. NZL]
MKLLTGFIPKALLTANKSYRHKPPKQRLLEVIELLDAHGELTDYNARLLEAIALSLFWDEKAYLKFETLGLELAEEQFNLAFINCEHDEAIASPENPRNWKK